MTLRSPDEPLRGAYCGLDELTAARFAARHIKWQELRRALARQSGTSRAMIRGRGLDFEEVRGYQAGDDIRTIDWRVTARAGAPFTKVFREERERPLLLAVDQRQPMFFGSRYCFKSALAAWLGAALAWAALARGDRVGGLVFGNTDRHDIRPRRSRRTVMAWLQTLHSYNHRLRGDGELTDPASSFQAVLSELERIARPGTSLIIVSDFAGAPTSGPLLQRLHRLARHGELTAIHVSDPLEYELPPPHTYTFSDGRRRLQIDTGNVGLRQRYRQHGQARRDALREALAQAGVPLLEAETAVPPLRTLGQPRGNTGRRAPTGSGGKPSL